MALDETNSLLSDPACWQVPISPLWFEGEFQCFGAGPSWTSYWVGFSVNSCGPDWGGLWAKQVMGSPRGYNNLLGSLLPGNSRLRLMWSALCHQLNFGWVRVFLCVMSVLSMSAEGQAWILHYYFISSYWKRSIYKRSFSDFKILNDPECEFVGVLLRMNNAPERVSIVGRSVKWG